MNHISERDFDFGGEIGYKAIMATVRCQGVIAGLAAAAVVGAGASAYAASEQADSQNKANAENQSNAHWVDDRNLMFALAARGGPLSGEGVPASLQGSQSAFLPYYFGNEETGLASDATGLYNSLKAYYGTPQMQLSDYQKIIDQYNPMFAQQQQMAGDISSGKTSQQMLAEGQPVWDARTATAQSGRNAALQQLSQTLNEIDAIQAKKGYAGDSLGNRMLKTNAGMQISSNAATALSAAGLQNAQERQGLQQAGRNLQLANFNLPDSLLQSAISRKTLPGNLVNATNQSSLTPFNWFRTAPLNARSQPLPTENPVASKGQIIAQGIGSLANSAGSIIGTFGNKPGGASANYVPDTQSGSSPVIPYSPSTLYNPYNPNDTAGLFQYNSGPTYGLY